jgi:gliding motility-associated-like protein
MAYFVSGCNLFDKSNFLLSGISLELRMTKKLLFFLPIFICSSLFAQEICNNGIDDDGDGFVDCFDSQCTGSTDCSDCFYGKPVANCTMVPTNPAFSLNNVWQSSVNVSTRSTMMVGDVDGDGSPEVVCHQDGTNQLYVLDGVTGTLEVTIACPPIADHVDAIAIGDTDDDGLGEIYVVTNDNVLRCFENDGTPKVGFTPPTTSFTQESIPGIADFNQDGIPEIYKDNRIYNSLTGALIAAGVGSTGNNPGSNGSPAAMPVAADVLPSNYCANCAGLELVCGNRVYAVDIAGGTLTSIANSLPGSLHDGFTSIADMDMDGLLDVIVTSNGTIYVWDPRTGLQIGNTVNIPNTSAGGRANIADYDNDGLPEIGAGGFNVYVVIDIDTATNILSQKWANTIVDGSEHTTASVFDFDCDGRAEVVYRDENNLFVWDGQTGNLSASIQCGSATRSEFPTIVDVDGDGQVNIVCACASSNGGAAGKVKVFNSSTNQWVASRKVMNQHSYSVVNINDNLAIPIQQQNHALIRQLNGFLAQVPIFDLGWSSSCIPLPDINVSVDSVIYCQKADSVILLINTCNIGSKKVTQPISVSVYNGNPLTGGTFINTTSITDTILVDSCSKQMVVVPFTGLSTTFYVFVNDNGSNASLAPQTLFMECDSSNNSDSVIITIPVVTLAITGDTLLCKYDTTILNVTGTTSYTWLPSTALSATSGSTVIANPLSTITYTVTGMDTNGCKGTDSITVIVNPIPIAIFGSTQVCDGTSTHFTDTSITSSGTISQWNWSFGDSSVDIIQNPLHLYDSAGIYQSTLIVANNFGCKDTVTKPVQVYYNPVANFTHTDVCFGDSVHFINTSSVDMSSSIASYLWDFGDNTPVSSVQNPVHYYATAGTYSVTLLVKTIDSCTNVATITVNVFDPPQAKFNFNNSCLVDSVLFLNTSINPTMGTIAHFIWDFGDNSSLDSVTNNPNHLYHTEGSYTVSLITFSSNLGCADTLKDTVLIFPMPVANFGTADVCLHQTTNFHDSSIVSIGTIDHWSWDFGDSSTVDSTQHPTHIYANYGLFAVSLISTTNYGCVDTFNLNTIVHPLPDVGFSALSVCNGMPVDFINNSFVATNVTNDSINNVGWTLGDNSALITTTNVTHLYADTGIYTVQLIAASTFGCVDSITKLAAVNPMPVVLFTTNDTIGCEPVCATFQNSSFVPNANVSSWSWNFGDSSASSNSQDAVHCYVNDSVNSMIQFSPQLTVTSDSGCVSILTKTNYITVYPRPVADFSVSPQTTVITEPVISILNTSVGADTNSWNFGDNQTLISMNPSPHTYSDTGIYTIMLISDTYYGCKDTAYQTVIVEPDFLFYIPNAFTPNDDGINDTFTGKGIFIKEFEMMIYDRWGNLIYKTETIDKPWDGKANKGTELAQADVYVYAIKVIDFKSIKHYYRGVVTVVR